MWPETMLTMMVPVERTNGLDVHRQEILKLMDMGCMIWRVMSGSGVRIGMERAIIVVH